jgi:hypothetical protein
MKGSFILKTLVVVLLIAFHPKISLATAGKQNIVIRETLMKSLQDTIVPVRTQTVVHTKDKKKIKIIKVLPKPHRQPIPVPVKVKVPKVKIIKPVVKPVIKIIH